MKQRYFSFLTCAVLATFLYGPTPAFAQPTLGTAANFAVLSSGAIDNNGATSISGHIGVGTGSAINGFPPGTLTHGTMHFGDSAAEQALVEVQVVHDGQIGPCTDELTGQDLGGRTLTPGFYCSVSSADLTGILVLDAGGNPDATFVIFVVGTLRTAANSIVVMGGGAKDCNVSWVVGCTAILGPGSQFVGNLIGLDNIRVEAGATVSGRLLARYGTVTMDQNSISIPECGTTAVVATTWGQMKQIYRN